jgi:uncharacterized cupredoxin-like copper-binding protein
MGMRLPMRAPFLATVLGLVIAGFASSCGGSSSPPPASGSSSPASSPTAASSSAGQAAGGNTVTVGESEFKITLSRTSFTAGTYTFVVKNSGAVPHAFEVKGEGVDAKTGTLNGGQSGTLKVTLTHGSYDVFCPIDGHKGLGMNVEIHVT